MEHTNELINVTIWGKDGCHHCMNAKIYCETHDLSFDYKLVNKDFTLAELKEKLPSVKTYPVIQINGKKRGLISTKPNMTEEKLFEIIQNDEKLMKYTDQKNIKKKIYIQDKLMNIIV